MRLSKKEQTITFKFQIEQKVKEKDTPEKQLCTFAEVISWKWLDNVFLPVIGSLIMFWIVAIN